MRRLHLGWLLLLTVLATPWTSVSLAQEEAVKPREIVIRDDFEQGMDRWEPTEAAKWRIHPLTPKNAVLELLGKSNYQPPHRSPHSIVWLKDVVVEDFVITVDVQTTQTSRGHRDMCVFFGEQDAANFYYVHLGEVTDDHSNQIFRVKDAPRIKISDKTTKGTPWKDETWHKIKVVRKVDSGLIEVYFDDMQSPQVTATDKSFGAGRVGLGSFDDMGYFDNFQLRGTAAADGKLPAANEGVNLSDPPDPASLEFFRWSGPVNVPDPVAISLDNQGKAYVTQSQRRKIQDLDIRENRDWTAHDVGFQTVDDKRAFYRERMAPERSESNTRRVPDLNKDGLHDYRDLTVISEKIHRVEDTTGDGVADKIELFAEGFATEVTGIAAGVLWHEGDVFATIAPDVWRLRDTTGNGHADQREVIATGFGLHIAYAGHDMHGLKVGPDGKIYWSIGDKGISVISKEGKSFQFPNQGGVLRCNLDGSDFEVFAHGLRNVQEFAFDAFGEIFAVDNDADMKGEKERFVYIAPGIDAGWRCNYQYRGSDFNPWMDEGLWETRHAEQPAYITPPLRHGHDGPAGFAFNPGTALNPAYRDYFFSTGAPNGNQYAFHVERDGASYEIKNYHQFGKGVPLVGINFGPDGGLYGVDWGGGYPLNQKGAIWKIDDPKFAITPERAEVSQLLAAGLADHNTASLAKLLGHADQRIRLEAQFELARRDDLETLTDHTAVDHSLMTRVHAIWGLGQLARQNQSEARETLARLLQDSDPEIQAQAIKTLADASQVDGRLFLPLLKGDSARVRMHAALALSRHPAPEGIAEIVTLIEKNNGHDLYLRHAGVMALVGQADVESLATHASEQVRIAAVVAMRRQRAKEVATFLQDQSPTVVAEAARAIHDDFSIPEALPHLAALLADISFDDPTILRRAINANFRLGTPEAAERLVSFISQTERAKEMRLVAIRSLAQWLQPDPLDMVDGRNRTTEFASRELDISRIEPALQAWLVEPTPEIQTAAMNLAKRLKVPLDSEALLAVIAAETLDIKLRVEALTTISSQNPDLTPKASNTAFRSNQSELRVEAVRATAPHDPSDAAAMALELMDGKPALRWRQEIVAIMATLADPRTDTWLATNIQQLIERPETELALDLYEAGHARSEANPLIASILEKLEKSFLNPETGDTLAAFQMTLRGGDAASGNKIFTTNVTAQCVRCHRLGNEGSDVGPNLAGIASRKDREYLLRAIVEPNADIEAKYRTRMLLLESGQVVQGVVKSESDEKIILTDNQGKDIAVEVESIEDEADQNISIMPEMIKQLSKREIRDLVAFLATLKEKPQGK